MEKNQELINSPVILAIESSCDETSVAVSANAKILANVTASQAIHAAYGGVVPELASRAHQENIIPVWQKALTDAKIAMENVDAIAYTRGPGLMGALLVGASFAKGLALATNKPLIEVNHLEAHVLSHFIDEPHPQFPFLCLLVSGGHTQIVLAKSPFQLEVIGKTLDDAAGEAFDKTAKLLGFEYPGGPLIDKYSQSGNPKAFDFPRARVQGFNYSFSGFKTAVLYFLREKTATDPHFIQNNIHDLCASIQAAIVNYLLDVLMQAAKHYNIRQIAIAGGVAANSGLRTALHQMADKEGFDVFIPKFEYCTDNAGMIARAALFKYEAGDFGKMESVPFARG